MINRSLHSRAKVRQVLTIALVIIGLVTLNGSLTFAAEGKAKTKIKRRIIPVTINKGQNYTITGVKEGTVPSSKVVNNPNALVMQNAPGRIEMVGADSGSWKINATLATGEKVTYVVTVKAEAPPQGSLNPVAAPTVIP